MHMAAAHMPDGVSIIRVIVKCIICHYSFTLMEGSAIYNGIIEYIRAPLFVIKISIPNFILHCLSSFCQTVKGGISETRVEKRIVISGDADIDHDEVRITSFVLSKHLLYLIITLHCFIKVTRTRNCL